MDTAILDSMVQQYESVFIGGMGNIEGYAINTLGLLIGIDFILSVLLNLENADHLKNLISKIFKYGFWIWIVQNYAELVNVILDSLTMVGFSVGGGMSVEIIKHPSQIIDQGIRIAEPFFQYIGKQNSMDLIFGQFGAILLSLFAILGIWLAFAILAIQVCVTYIEFYVCATLLFIFIPFGANKYFSFLAEKAIGGIISFGVKLMVLGAIIGVSGPIVNSWGNKINFDGTPEFHVVLSTVTACWIITFLAWQVPAVAASIMSGAPSLSAGTVAGAGIAAAAGAMGGTMIASGGAKMAASAAGGATKAAATAAGAFASGGLSGLGNAAASAASSMGQGMKDSVMSSFKGGMQAGSGLGGGGSQGATGAGANSNNNSSGGMSNMALASQAQRAVPPEGTPQGGIQASIKSDD